MCGIAVVLESLQLPRFGSTFEAELVRQLSRRGPDFSAQLPLAFPSTAAFSSRVFAAVLHLRGDQLAPQPAVDALGNVLCWNGEAFGAAADPHVSDTQQLADELLRAAAPGKTGDGDDVDEGDKRVLTVLRAVRGPFAFAYAHAARQRLYFGHDRFGRRSLLYHWATRAGERRAALAELAGSGEEPRRVQLPATELARLCVSSVAIAATDDAGGAAVAFDEVPANGIFVLDFSGGGDCALEFHPYPPLERAAAVRDRYDCGLPLLRSPGASGASTPLERAANGLLAALSNAVGVRVRTVPRPATPPRGANDADDAPPARVAVLFSGGLDSVVLAALAHFHAPAREPVDLLNVCFDAASGFRSPDRLAAELSVAELRALFPARAWRFVRVDVPFAAVRAHQRDVAALMAPCDTHMDFNIGAAFWFLARAQGRQTTTAPEAGAQLQLADLNAFLVRGEAAAAELRALEAAVRALRLCGHDSDSAGDSRDECPLGACKRKKKPGCVFGICRLCCLKTHKLLDKLRRDTTHPSERLKSTTSLFDMGVVSSDEQLQALLTVLSQHTADDDSERLASRATGAPACRVHRQRVHPSASVATAQSTDRDDAAAERARDTAEAYTSPARVLLVGIGADEQLGGYGRHKTAFETGGAQALRDELALDMRRIWKRNLGRDDRCISAHGKEARFPFLDEDVVAFVGSLPVECICDLSQPRGAGDKLVLRVAGRQLGLRNCTGLAKRAIQFGTRLAKHSNAHAFGSNRQATGDAKFEVR
ncbi:hypothetical protein PybrP1_002994 [[Pythium] brassicae (nom. inval.)]|nr:hypothetical protein PybrP1_002994 [[Pythium] brassicae (nom. inval.)]